MIYSKQCQKCGREFTFPEERIEDLSRTEQLLCAKEGLDFANMVKTTCGHCGTSSLSLRKDLKRLDDQPSLTADDPVAQEFVTFVSKLKDLSSRAFVEPGPLFNESRKGIIEKWLANFATNIEAAAKALTTHRDIDGNAMPRQQVADAVTRMCDEYCKGLQRLEEVCGSQVRQQFEAILSEVRVSVAKTQQPGPTSADGADSPQPAKVQSVDTAATQKAPAKIDGFIVLREYIWPDCCVCCGDHPETTKELTTEFDLAAMERLGIMDISEILSKVHAAAERIGNLEVTFDAQTKQCFLKLKVNYCSSCRSHDKWANAFLVALGLAIGGGFWAVLIGIVIAMINGWSAGLTRYAVIVCISGLAFSIIAYLLNRKYWKVAKEVCGPPERDAVKWKLDKSGIGWIEFGNRQYAQEFTEANGLNLANTVEDKSKSAAIT